MFPTIPPMLVPPAFSKVTVAPELTVISPPLAARPTIPPPMLTGLSIENYTFPAITMVFFVPSVIPATAPTAVSCVLPC